MELAIRSGFFAFQLMTILEEAYHSLIVVLHEDSQERMSIHLTGVKASCS
jgi:hypothetical protein